MPSTTREKRWRWCSEPRSPKRSESRIAIGRAPIAKMSRRMPPTPVAAPWKGDRRGMVVALDLERDRQPVADVDHAGVLARPLEHPVARRREAAQERPRMLVAAVLAPQQREDRELEVVRLARQEVVDALVL